MCHSYQLSPSDQASFTIFENGKTLPWEMFCNISNKTGLQPVSRSVEQVHYFEGWGVGAKPTLCKVLRTGSGARCIKVGTKVYKKTWWNWRKKPVYGVKKVDYILTSIVLQKGNSGSLWMILKCQTVWCQTLPHHQNFIQIPTVQCIRRKKKK